MSTLNQCESCQHDFPATASFCPHCGAEMSAETAPFNRTLVSRLILEPTGDETMQMEPIEDFRPGRAHGLKLFVGVAATAAVAAGVWVGAWLSDFVYRPAEAVAVTAPVVVEAASAEPAAPEVVVSPNPNGGFDIMRDAEIIHTVTTHSGSRYNTLDERMRSVGVRFKHIKQKGEGRFAARLAGDHYELVWADDSGDFRLLDVTAADVARTDGNPDFVANYLADRLNADLPAAHPNT